MDYQSVSEQLLRVERKIVSGDKLIAAVRENLRRAIRNGADPGNGESLLQELEAAQQAHIAERMYLKAALKQLVH